LVPKRQFFGDWDRDLWKEAYAFIPQQSVTDKTKWILLHILDNYPWLRICGESHDAGLLLCPDIGSKIDEAYDIIKSFGEQPIDFSSCSIPRRNLVIPIDVEIGRENYKELKKYKRISHEVRIETRIIEPSAKDVYKSLRNKIMTWIERLIEETREYEAPRQYYFWSGLAAISAVVKDHVYLERGSDRMKTYPNVYILILAKTGITKKSHPISLIEQIVVEAQVTRVISGRIY
jgi:hypothetical protein